MFVLKMTWGPQLVKCAIAHFAPAMPASMAFIALILLVVGFNSNETILALHTF